MRKATLLVVIGVACFATAGAGQRLNPSDFSYLGAFRLPDVIGPGGQYVNGYGNRGMTFDPAGDGGAGSLLLTGHDWVMEAFEIRIPTPLVTSYGGLNTASILTPPFDTVGGIACGEDSPWGSGIEIHGPYMWFSCAYRYTVSGENRTDVLWRRNLDLSNLSGPYRAGPQNGVFHSNRQGAYMFSVPVDWANAHLGGNKSLGTGQVRNSHGGAAGPTFYAFDPSNPSNAEAIFYYPPEGQTNNPYPTTQCGPDHVCWLPDYTPCDLWNGAAWAQTGTADALLLSGANFYGNVNYEPGGWVCDEGYAEILMYDPDDFVDSINGIVDPWQVLPYERWRPAERYNSGGEFGGMAFDPATGKLYVVEKWVADGGKAAVHVFQTQGAGPPPDPALSVNRSGAGTGYVYSTPGGIDCGADCYQSYAPGTQVVLTATADAGSIFSGLSGHTDCADGVLTMNSARSCTATFDLETPTEHLLTVSKTGTGTGVVVSSPAGISCGSDCQQIYLHGQVVGLSVWADPGSTFSGWSGDADCSDGTVTMNSARSCAAHFATESQSGGDYCPAYAESPLFRSRQRQVPANPSNWISLIEGAQSGDEILLADGTYSLNQYAVGISSDITIRGASGNRDAVLIVGQGYGVSSEGFMIAAPNVTIADLSMTDIRTHAIAIKGELGAEAPHVYNVHLYDIGTQHIKGTPGDGVNNGVIACSKIGYSPGGVAGDYLHGIDIHTPIDWVIRDNELYNIWGEGTGCEVDTNCGTYTPGGGPAIILWNNASGNIVERNRIIDSFRGIALGFIANHAGGIVRNNFIYQSEPGRNGANGWIAGDTGIAVWGTGTRIEHNTVILGGDYPGAIEVQNSSNLEILNNLLTRPIWNRGNATYNAQGNKTDAVEGDLASPGDVHLNPNSGAVDFASTVTIPDVTTDIDGDPRSQGLRPDAGADESSSEGGPPQRTLTVSRSGNGAGTVSSVPSGINCGTDCSEEYDEDTVVSLTASASPGSQFTGWSGSGDCSDGQVTMSSNLGCTATFELLSPEQYTLTVTTTGVGSGTVTSSPGGINCGSDCSEIYTEGTVIQLSASADPGSIFNGWSGAADCSDGSVTLNADTGCTATFVEAQGEAGLIAAFGLNEGGGSNAGDASGQQNNGTVVGASWTPQGYFGGALAFDGVNDYIDMGGMDVNGSGVTLSAWFKADNLNNCSYGDCRVLSKATGTAENEHYFMLSTIRVDPDYRLRLRLKTGGTTTTLIADSGNLTNGQWIHAAAVYDGTTMELFLNGVSVGSRAKSGSMDTSGAVPTWIGGNPPGPTAKPWNGALDEIRMYTRALTAAEIQQDMITPIGDPGQPIQMTLAIDRSGSGTGTVTSSPGGINCGADCTEDYDEGTVVALTATPNADSEFTGWSGSSDCSDGQVTMDGNRNCTATFTLLPPEQHSVTVWKTGDGSGMVTSSPAGISCGNDCQENYDEGTVVSLITTPEDGSEFTGWSGDGDCSDGQLTVMTARNCTATFVLLPPELFSLTVSKTGSGSGTVSSTPGGIDCGSDCSENYPENSVISLSAIPDAGSQFAGWAGSPDCADGQVTMNGNQSCTASFGQIPPQQFNLSVEKSGEGDGTVTSAPVGIDCGADCDEDYVAGTEVTLTAVPSTGSEFVGWWGAGDCLDGQITVTEDVTCTATFSLEEPTVPDSWTLSIRQEGNGSGLVESIDGLISCGNDCWGSYDSGAAVVLTATAGVNSEFSGWSGDNDCTDGQVTMTSSVSCVATFSHVGAPDPGTLMVLPVSSGNAEMGIVTSTPSGISCGEDCDEWFQGGASVTLEAVPAPGTEFGGWWGPSVCNESTSGGAGEMTTIAVQGDLTCTAVFVPIGQEVIKAISFESGGLGRE